MSCMVNMVVIKVLPPTITVKIIAGIMYEVKGVLCSHSCGNSSTFVNMARPPPIAVMAINADKPIQAVLTKYTGL